MDFSRSLLRYALDKLETCGFLPNRHAGVGLHPENEASKGGIWIPAQRAAQVRDDGVLP